jgi:hypothetical protein
MKSEQETVQAKDTAPVKVKISADRLRLAFSPQSYVALVNIAGCFAAEDEQLTDARTTARREENVKILEQAHLTAPVLLRSGGEFCQRYAALSGSYLYFFDRGAGSLDELVAYCQARQDPVGLTIDDSTPELPTLHRPVGKHREAIARLRYEEYFVVKGCFGRNCSVVGSSQLKLVNSLGATVTVQFDSGELVGRWKEAIHAEALRIRQLLGKPAPLREEYTECRKLERSASLQSEAAQKRDLEAEDAHKVTMELDVEVQRCEIVVNGRNRVQLGSSYARDGVHDAIVLSVEEAAQFSEDLRAPDVW